MGFNVLQHFARQGWETIGIDRSNFSRTFKGMENFTFFKCDLTKSLFEFRDVVPDVLIHCAGVGLVSFSNQNAERSFEDIAHATTNALLSIRRYPNTKCIILSSAAVYGQTKSPKISELELCNPISTYGLHKLTEEWIAKGFASSFGLSIAIMRTFSAFGIGNTKQLLWDACQKLSTGDGSFSGTGAEIRDWVHIYDVCRLAEVLIDVASPICPIVNCGTGNGRSNLDLLKLVCQKLHVDDSILRFNGIMPSYAPYSLVANINKAHSIGWNYLENFESQIENYVRWQCSLTPSVKKAS